ncbi:MAG: porin [Pseudomonadota bacterium]
MLRWFACLLISSIFPAMGAAGHQENSGNMETFSLYSWAHLDASGDGLSVRRLRIGSKGSAFLTSRFKLELDVDDDGTVEFRDAFAQITDSQVTLKLGAMRTPNSVNALTSSRLFIVLERAAFTRVFSLDRRVGFSAAYMSDKHALSAGVFAGNANGLAASTGFALAVRAMQHQKLGAQYELMLAASYLYRQKPIVKHFYGLEAALYGRRHWVIAEVGRQVSAASPGSPAQPTGLDDTISGIGGYIEFGIAVRRNGPFRPYDAAFGERPSDLYVATRLDILQVKSCTPRCHYSAFTLGLCWRTAANIRIAANVFFTNTNIGTRFPDAQSFAPLAKRRGSAQGTGALARLQLAFG